jgi:hypothetical protein
MEDIGTRSDHANIVLCARLPNLFAKHVEDEREIIHAWVTPRGQHPMQAFARRLHPSSQALKSDGAMDEITKGETGQRWLTLDEDRLGFVEKHLGKSTIMSNALDDRVS